MPDLTELLLPALLAAVAVFLVSSVLHMLLPIHKGDYGTMPSEDQVLDAMRKADVPPGHYMLPGCSSMQEMQSPDFQAKLNQGPVGFMTLRKPGPFQMGKSLGQWFVFSLLVSVCIAYVLSATVPYGDHFTLVWRVACTIGFLTYGLSYAQESIWKCLGWKIAAKFWFDGALYGLATGAVFAAMWPSGS